MTSVSRNLSLSPPALATADNTAAGNEVSAGVGEPRCNLFYSSAVEGYLSELLGAPHYSYRFAEAKFVSTITRHGHTINKLLMPEYYGSPAAVPPAKLDRTAPSVHLIFRSTEHIRLLKFAWNICCFAWEFDVLKDDTNINEHPFLNQRRMLSLCDEIWVPCHYTRMVLDRHDVKSAHVIPAPIVIPSDGRVSLFDALTDLGHVIVAPMWHNFPLSKSQKRSKYQKQCSTLVEYIARRLRATDGIRIYLTILNPEDFRKNLDSLLRAFHYFSTEHKNAVLLVKALAAQARFTLFDLLSDVIPPKLADATMIASDSIMFFNDYLSDIEMSQLYRMADYYLCASICEGQNLPLLEAMSHGVVPVTTANTAMMDYITPGNAVIINDELVPNNIEHLAGAAARKPFSIRISRVEDVHDALVRSAALSSSRYMRMSKLARATVQKNYAPDVVWSLMQERFAVIRGAATARSKAWTGQP